MRMHLILSFYYRSCVTVYRLFHLEASNLDVVGLFLPYDTFYIFSSLPYNTSQSIFSIHYLGHKIFLSVHTGNHLHSFIRIIAFESLRDNFDTLEYTNVWLLPRFKVPGFKVKLMKEAFDLTMNAEFIRFLPQDTPYCMDVNREP